jgi:UDP-2,4-diacetamido-2,4,6-trideoxy-beta-L-altropyranose hydrolase
MNAGVPRVLFRCDASPAIGAGHVSRCLALAEVLAQTGWRVAFAASRGAVATMSAMTTGGFSLHELSGEADDEAAELRSYYPDGVDLFVVDHYQRDIYFEEACRSFARQILVMDDATGRRHDCDILVDAAATDRAVYAGGVPAHARLLLGPAYALMRRVFMERRADALQRRDGRSMKNILVSFGATDPCNVTPIALDALDRYADDFSINVALSSYAPHLDEVRSKLRGRMQLMLDADMPVLTTEADLAIGAAGSSSYERAILGLPSIIVTVADNQRGIAKVLTAAGAATDAGEIDKALTSRLGQITRNLIDDPGTRIRMAEAAAALVDGRSGQRLLIGLIGEASTRDGLGVRLRLVESNDSDWLLEFQREPQTRRHFRNPGVPSAQEHGRWMKETLTNSDVFFLMIEVDGELGGYVRLDRLKSENATFEISVAVSPRLYGRGIGLVALSLVRRLQPAAEFDAEILPENAASRALFTRAGYRQVSDSRYRQRFSF